MLDYKLKPNQHSMEKKKERIKHSYYFILLGVVDGPLKNKKSRQIQV